MSARRSRHLVKQEREATDRVADAIVAFVGNIPATKLRRHKVPEALARTTANKAAAKAALAAGTLALPTGPVGWLTILPEMLAVWKIQAQMVADIAGIYGKKHGLTREQMIYCLFRQTAAQAVRDLVVRVGERFLVRRVSLRAIQDIARSVGIRVTRQSIGKGIARLMPIVGAVGVGGYAYYDTAQVARTAMELFAVEIAVEPRSSEDP